MKTDKKDLDGQGHVHDPLEDFAEELGRVLANGAKVHFVDTDIPLASCRDEEMDEEDDPIHIHFRANIVLPVSESKQVDWEERFYDIAKAEYLRQNRVFSSDNERAIQAIASASTFIKAMKEVVGKEH